MPGGMSWRDRASASMCRVLRHCTGSTSVRPADGRRGAQRAQQITTNRKTLQAAAAAQQASMKAEQARRSTCRPLLAQQPLLALLRRHLAQHGAEAGGVLRGMAWHDSGLRRVQ